LCAYQVWKRREAREAFFWLACLAGTLLMAVMVRFHVYGSFAICLPWLVFIDERVKKTTASAVFVMVLVLACSSAPRSLFRTKVAAADPYYALTYDAYPDLARECEQSPGVALSNLDDANYIRFHTRCGVIANNFLLTAFHEKKVREARALLNTPAAELTRVAPQVRYVFVHRQSLFQLRPDGGMQFLPGGSPELPDPKLVSDLIDAPANALPPGFRVVKELAFEKPSHVVYARVLAIEPGKDPS
jgi:hypothetical protein